MLMLSMPRRFRRHAFEHSYFRYAYESCNIFRDYDAERYDTRRAPRAPRVDEMSARALSALTMRAAIVLRVTAYRCLMFLCTPPFMRYCRAMMRL